MRYAGLNVELPERLVHDFASDPLAPFDKLLTKAHDSSWPLYPELSDCLARVPPEGIRAAFTDRTFVALYGKAERLARIWVVERCLIEESARRRLQILSKALPGANSMPYAADCLRGARIDAEGLVQLAGFNYNESTLLANQFSFNICSTTESPNSSYWLLRAFYEQGIADHVNVRLDPFLWGPSDSFPQMTYKMIVYARPLNWDGIGKLKKQHHGKMRADKSEGEGEITEFLWDPRQDGIHFICEELPTSERVDFAASRYLHAIYDPASELVIHFDGALRIYNRLQLQERNGEHLRRSGKTGIRRKIFRIDEPVDREAFSLIAQAFFVWNYDLATYFSETLTS
jgi:hypothetical protein